MKVLQLCNKPPFPAKDGGCIAMKSISEGLLDNNVNLKILTIETQKHPFIKDEFPQIFLQKTKIESVFVDTRLNIVDAFSALVTSDSYNISRFFSSDFNKRLIELLTQTEYDVIHLESLFLTPYIYTIRRYSKAKVILRSHNLEHLIWERLANLEKNRVKKIYLQHLSKKLKTYEIKVLNDVDAIATISSEDYKRYKMLNCKVPLKNLPFGLDIDDYHPSYKENILKKTLDLFHLGSMDWLPNVKAVNWFLDDVFPKLNNIPIRLNLAGKNMPVYLLDIKTKNLIVKSEVDSAIKYMSKFDVMVVPLMSGSGMRIKIIEAMALGKTVISTSIGLEGIDVEDGKEVLIANSSEEFIEKIKHLYSNLDEIKIIGQNARLFIEKNHSNSLIIKDLLELYKNN
jgi:glycosyltransferase involved in cell wall biosynthesis